MFQQSLSLAGVVADSEAGSGLTGLSIEVWSLDEGALKPLAEGRSDADGAFALTVPLGRERQIQGAQDGRVRIELRIRDGGELLLAQIRELAVESERQPIRISVPRSAPALSENLDTAADQPEPSGADMALQSMDVESEVSEYGMLERHLSLANDEGPALLDTLAPEALFDLGEELAVEPERLALLQRARALAAETGLPGPLFYALGSAGLPLELEDLLDVPLPELHTTVVAAVADGVVDEGVMQGIDGALSQLAERVLESALAAERTGLEVGLGDVLAAADLPRETLRDVLSRYQARTGTIDEFWESLAGADGEQEAVSEEARSALEMAADLDGLLGGESALIQRMFVLRREGRWQSLEDLAEFDYDDWCELLESLDAPDQAGSEADPGNGEDAVDWFGDGTDSDACWGGEDGVLDGHDDDPLSGFDHDNDATAPDVLGYGHDAQPDSEGLDWDGWEAAAAGEPPLDGDAAADPASAADGFDGFDDADGQSRGWVEARAEAILDTLEEAFPGAYLRRTLRQSQSLCEAGQCLLDRVPKHDFHNQSIRQRVAQDAKLLEGLEPDAAAAALEEFEAIERVSRVTHRADAVLVLVGSGLNSAQAIAAEPRTHFIDAYGEALGGRAQASRVHGQAQQVDAGNMLAVVRLLQALQQTPLALGGSIAQDRAMKGIPDARTLFGSLGFCACEHCRSVYSPAAYLVDLLRYLDLADPKRITELEAKLNRRSNPLPALRRLQYQPLDVLLARRPDLADLPLTCENTLTPLPYIDLVNELLESRVTGRSAAHDTGSTPADVLKAVPQYVDRDAYERLRQAIYPIALPFHEPLAVARAFLGHLGVQRRDLLSTFADAATSRDALLAESLEMSPEEYAIVAATPAELWRHVGFEAEQVGGRQYIDLLAHVPTFLHRMTISFQDLADLASTRFVNLDGAIKLEMPSSDCDPELVRITGLDDSRLSRMLRLLRLQRRLGLGLLDLDRALFALGARDLGPEVLQQLVEMRDLGRQLERPVPELLALWASLDTFGQDSQFERLLRTRAVAWRLQDADSFKLAEGGAELAQTADRLDPVAPALLAAFRITSEELALAIALNTRLAGAPPRLDLAGISAVYRVALLARALNLRVGQLDGLLRLVPAEANPFRPADPAATGRFVAIIKEVQSSGFTPEQLLYLYAPAEPLRPGLAPTETQVGAVLAGIRRAQVDAFNETARPNDPTGDFLRQKLALWLDPPLVDPAMQALDPRTRLTAADRRQFFVRHLAGIFPDPDSAAVFLFGAPPPAAAAAPTASPPVAVEAAPGTGLAAGTESASTPITPPASGPAAPPGPTHASAADRQWQAIVERVLADLLPLLRTRQMRGAVIRSLSDALGTSALSTGRLLDGLLRSRRGPGRPLFDDFLALLGTGLTGSYFANPTLDGAPSLTRIDPRIELSWAGAAPAPGIAGTGFSVRWTGRLLPRTKAPHNFFVSTDGAVRLLLNVDGSERVLLDEPGGSGAVAHYLSSAIALDPARLYGLRIEYRNRGGAASIAVQIGTAPDSRQAIPTVDLFPADGLAGFDPVALGYCRLHKAALLLTGLGITDGHLHWLTREPRYLDLDQLVMAPTDTDTAVASFQRWRQLAAVYGLRKRLPRSASDLFAVFQTADLPAAISVLVQATGWDRGVVEAFLSPQGFAVGPGALALPLEPIREPLLLRLERAVAIQRRAGVSAKTLFAWAARAPDADLAAAIVQAVKARYDERRWIEVAERLNESLRVARREALVAYLLPRLREQGVRNRSQLFEYFLIDVEMGPCMLTSRIKQAISAVQTFYQRCLMNLEEHVNPRLIDEEDWKWLKNYRVWEANRKVFLYPENWIEPELRDDKSPEFKILERTILQQEIKKENVESAFIDYLQRLDEISRLDVRAVWFERRQGDVRRRRVAPGRLPQPGGAWQEGTYHIFARTYNAPHHWFYRRLEKGRVWTPWEKIDADIEGDHLVPVVFQNRMHLFWTVFREKSKPEPELKKDAAPFKLGKDWEIGLAYSVYDRGRWTRKLLSSGNVVDRAEFVVLPNPGNKVPLPRVEGSTWLPTSAYTLKAEPSNSSVRLQINLFRRAIDKLQAAQTAAPRGESGSNLLSRTDVELVASFALEGCNGELAPVFLGPTAEVVVGGGAAPRRSGRRRGRGRAQPARLPPATRLPPFRFAAGGRMPAPPGFAVDGTGFGAIAHSGPLLTLPLPSGALAPVLGRSRGDPRGIRVLPILDPAAQQIPELFPFFFQDRSRTYFVRPVPRAAQRPVYFLRTPLVGPAARGAVLRFGARPRVAGPKGLRPARGRGRESLEMLADESALDAALGLAVAAESAPVPAPTVVPADTVDEGDEWEDLEDAAWHPDDAEARRKPRQRTRPPTHRPTQGSAARRLPARPTAAAPARPVAALGRQRRPAPRLQQQLRFMPFEHPQTCRLINTLLGDGIDVLLGLATTRGNHIALDHRMADGRWQPTTPSRFEREYRPSALVDRQFPRLDIDFEPANAYALYNWELFFHAPLQVATQLAKDGRHEEAQRWFHFIFDPTSDSSAPAPRRYWRFAPFHENTEYDDARRLLALLSYAGKEPVLLERRAKVEDQVYAWREQPFSPHTIARLRIAAYQKAVVMKYIDNLIEWGDKLFRRDTMESIQEATQLYILAGNILGQRPERIPPPVATAPVTFRTVRTQLDAFANWAVRFENSQVRRPFQVNARPEVGATTSVLGMATLYFCIPPNPELDKKWDMVADRLYKIRNCMNISGTVRRLALFEPPIDPGMLVRAAAAGVDLGSVIASLNAPPPIHRYRFLVQRALGLAEDLRRFGAAMLNALERRDAERLAALRQSHETTLLEAIRDIHKTKVKQVEEELAWLALQRESVDIEMAHVQAQAQQLMIPQESAKQQSLTAAQAIAGVAEGIDLAAKVAYAIPEFQGGSAGGFSSPFVTVQMGGKMFGDIATAVAESMFKIMNRHQTEAEMAGAQAEYQRRQAELMHRHQVLAKERERMQKQIAEIQLKLEIGNAELRRHETAMENARKAAEYLRDKYTNEELYGWMLGQLSGTYFQAYKLAFDMAKLAERALQFERGDTATSYIAFSYWDSLKRGLLAGERLTVDIRRMEAAQLEDERRALEITRQVSLKSDAPAALEELLATGRCQLELGESLFDADFPGHYFRRTKTVSMAMTMQAKPGANINCTLTLLENRVRTNANASGTYPQAQDGDDPRFLPNPVPVQVIATSRQGADPGLFQLRFDDDRYLPFEGAGAISTWRIELHQSDNAVDLSELSDVVLSLSYTAKSGGATLEAAARANRETGLARGGLVPPPQHRISLRRDLPDAWRQLQAAAAGQSVEVALPVERAQLPGRLLPYKVGIESVTVYAQTRSRLADDALRVQLAPPGGTPAPVLGWLRPWPDSQTLRAQADLKGDLGAWKLNLTAQDPKVLALLLDLALVLDLRARREQG